MSSPSHVDDDIIPQRGYQEANYPTEPPNDLDRAGSSRHTIPGRTSSCFVRVGSWGGERWYA